MKCSSCNSEFIELVEGQSEPSQAPGSGNEGDSGSNSNQMSLSDMIKMAHTLHTVTRGASRMMNNIERNYGTGLRDIISVISNLTGQNVSRSFTNQNGERQSVSTNLGDLLAPLISTFGFLSGGSQNNRNPASENEIDELEEVQIKRCDYEFNEETKEQEPPKCSI